MAQPTASPGARDRPDRAPYARCVPRSTARTLTSPRMLLLHALGLAAVTVALLLASWQYDAWRAGREIAARDLADASPVPLDDVLGPDDPESSNLGVEIHHSRVLARLDAHLSVARPGRKECGVDAPTFDAGKCQ